MTSNRFSLPAAGLPCLGQLADAEETARRARESVPAYRHFLSSHSVAGSAPFTSLPRIDKTNYLTQHDFANLLAGNFNDTFTIFKSSGSSGRSFFWPQLKENHRSSRVLMQAFLEAALKIGERSTLAVIGLALGSWIGGEHFSWLLKSVALESPHRFAVFSPGSNHREIIDVVSKAGRFVDQILIVVCPSAIGHLLLLAEQSGCALPLEKMRFIVIGEPFPESLRLGLHKRANLPLTEPILYSMYGSADTGALGFESPASIALRQILSQDQSAAKTLGFGATPPHFFHFCGEKTYLESINGELCVTKWQGIPLVRYNLHDSVGFFGWREFRALLLSKRTQTAAAPELYQVLEAAGETLPDLLSVSGRSDGGLILCGTNFNETQLDAAVRSPELAGWLSGAYKARVKLERERQFLEFDLEFLKDVPADPKNQDAVYAALVQALGREQPEFLDDWRNIYTAWDDDPDRRILRFRCFAWPELSQRAEKEIKQRGIQK